MVRRIEARSLAVGEAFGGGGRAAPADEAEGAGRDARARRVGLVGGDGLESERGADVLDCGERVGVVEREVGLGGFGAVVHGAENPSCARERFFAHVRAVAERLRLSSIYVEASSWMASTQCAVDRGEPVERDVSMLLTSHSRHRLLVAPCHSVAFFEVEVAEQVEVVGAVHVLRAPGGEDGHGGGFRVAPPVEDVEHVRSSIRVRARSCRRRRTGVTCSCPAAGRSSRCRG